ncbi:MAG: M28 family peptidase [Planctomycetota bacterium]|nr:M28 family peptidase [Planctomycetota bacterium]
MADPRTFQAPPAGPRAHARRCLLALCAWVVASALGYFSLDRQAVAPLTAPGNQFSAQRAREAMDGVLPVVIPHPAGSSEAQQVRTRIADHLRRLGYQPEEQTRFAVGSGGVAGTINNVLARRNGREAGPALLCVAHYDSVWAGPGVADDLSGVGVLLELARIQIEARRSRQPVVFLFTDAEEQGLVGAAGFLDHPMCEDVGLVMNFEARGGSGVAYMFETGRGNAELMRMYADCVSHPTAASLTTEIYKRLPNDTDFSFFRDAGLAGFNFAFIEDMHVYHTPLDDFDHLSLASLQHEGEQAAQLMERWTNHAPPPAGEEVGDAIYGSLPGNWMIIYGETTARWLSLLCLLALVWAVHASVTRSRVLWSEVAGGLGLAILCVVGGSLISVLWSSALRSLAGTPNPWLAQPLWLLGIQLGWVLCLWLAVVAAWGNKVGRVGTVLGAVLGWGLTALATALFMPGVSFLFTPVVVVMTATLYLTLRDAHLHNRLARGMAGTLPVAALIWIPAHRGLVAAAGPGVELALLLPILVLGTVFMPLLIGIPIWLRHSLKGLGALLLCVSTVGTLWAPAQSAQRPTKLNLVYAQDLPAAGEAQWQARTGGAPLPEEFAKNWGFEETESRDPGDSIRPPGWSGGRTFVAPAPHLGLDPPRLELAPGEWVGDGRDLAWRILGTLYPGRRAAGIDERVLRLHTTRVRGITRAAEEFLLTSPADEVSVRTQLSVLGSPHPVRLLAQGTSLGTRKHFTILDIPDVGMPVEIWIEPDPSREQKGPVQDVSSGPSDGRELHLRLVDRRSGLPFSAVSMMEDRPNDHVPAHDGDGIMVSVEMKLTLPPVPTGEGEAE